MTYREDIKEYVFGKTEKKISIMKGWGVETPDLFRYRGMTEYPDRELEALRNNNIWCSPFNMLNDPEEGINIRNISRLVFKYNPVTFVGLKIVRKQYGVSCFTKVDPLSQNADDMWNRYANNRNGICIQYKMSDMIQKSFFIIPVTYIEKMKIFDFWYKNRFFAELSFATKYKYGKDTEKIRQNWEQEQEWRHIIKLDKRGRGQYCEISLKAHTVYLGQNLDREHKERLKTLLTDVKIVEL